MRKPLVAGNWKMNLEPGRGAALVAELLPLVADSTDMVDVVVCPTNIGLAAASAALAGGGVTLGAQNCHWEEAGAFTGEVGPGMLLTVGCQWVILGHSERRLLFGESDEGVNRRAVGALASGLQPIVCIGCHTINDLVHHFEVTSTNIPGNTIGSPITAQEARTLLDRCTDCHGAIHGSYTDEYLRH